MQRHCPLLLFIFVLLSSQCTPPVDYVTASPDGTLRATLIEQAGQLFYTLTDDAGAVYVDTSRLGLRLTDRAFAQDLRVLAPEEREAGRTQYTLLTGKQRDIGKPYAETRYTLQNADRQPLRLELRLYNDGLAFRYVLPDSSGQLVVTEELTEFVLPPTLTAWRQPHDAIGTHNPAYERYFNKSNISEPMSDGESIVLPLLAYDDKRAVLLHESAPEGQYFGASLVQNNNRYRITTPRGATANGLHDTNGTLGDKPYTPWRIVVAGPGLETPLATTLPTDLSPERQVTDTDWIRPGRAAWSWWSDNDSPQDFGKQKRFIDFAAAQGWDYSLVDANWNVMEGGTLEELAAYAATKGVGLLVWYNSGGPHNSVTEMPRDRMLDPVVRRREMKKLQTLGVAGIKVDFFQSDKQAILQQYLGILRDGAEHELLINFHGCTVPRGWRRSYPNLMTMEAVSGAECYIFREDYEKRAPEQNTILPFTRNAVGPMDFTPVTFTKLAHPRLTTDAHELALAVLFESGIQHFADDPDAYRALPDVAQRYLAEVPTVWDEIQLVDMVPGEYLALARRHGERWYVAAINGTDRPVTLRIDDFNFGPLETFIGDDGAGGLSVGPVATTDSVQLVPYGGAVWF